VTREPGLAVSEVFGPTFQGEGPSAGRLAAFIRLSGCPLSCQWCDTPWTWQWDRFDRRAEQRRITVPELLAWALGQPARLVVITGGEPLLQARMLPALTAGLAAGGAEVEIETSGVIAPSAELTATGVMFNVSPKLANSGMPADRRIRGSALRALAGTGKARFKFVAVSPGDLDEIGELQAAYGLSPVWVMPEGTGSGVVLDRMRDLAEAVIGRGWNLSSRLHVLLWEDARGR
jgi:7-carboxy-7-deazaguanine synthase